MRDLVFSLIRVEYFTVLGLEPSLALDPEDLERRFYSRSRELHPDRFARAPKAEQQRVLMESALLNDAYRTLRHPLSRAEYFLRQSGVDSTDVPEELLEEMFELNLAKEQGQDISGPVQRLLDEVDRALPGLFAQWDATRDPAVLGTLRATLNRRRYLENILHGHA